MKRKILTYVNLPLFPWLCIISYILHFQQQNPNVISTTDMTLVFLLYAGASLLLFLIGKILIQDRKKSMILLLFFLSIEFYLPPLQEFFRSHESLYLLGKYSILLPIIIICTFLLIRRLRKEKEIEYKLIQYFNLLFIIIIALDSTLILIEKTNKVKFQTTPSLSLRKTPAKKPNIYLLIADEYAGTEQLNQQFQFNNSSFINKLKEKGFKTAKWSRSNYNYTPFSMASILNMDYLYGLNSMQSNDQENQNLAFESINENPLTHFLQQQSYQIFNGSPFHFDQQEALYAGSELYTTGKDIILSKTFSTRLRKELWFHLLTTLKIDHFRDQYLDELRENIEKSRELTLKAKSRRPVFVYSHFIMPHYPYLFTSQGEKLQFDQATDASNPNNYIEFLKYANNFFLNITDSLLKKDPRSIIILMSDHGYTKFQDTSLSSYNFCNMVNIHFPKENQPVLPDSISNVNIFRFILNTQFSTDLPILPHKEIFLYEK